MAAIRARELYLEAGRPIDAAGQQICHVLGRTPRAASQPRTLRAYVEQGFAEIADLPTHAGTREPARPG